MSSCCAKKSSKIIFALIVIAIVTSLFVYLSCCRTSPADRAFIAIADQYFDEYYFPTNPSLSTQLGIHRYDDQLEDYSKSGIEKQIVALKKYEKQIAAIEPSPLSEEVQGDRELVLNNIRGQLLSLQTIRSWEKNPDFYSSGIASSTFVIMSRQFSPAEQRLQSLIAREKLMPGALLEARANLKNTPKVFTEIALEQLPAIIIFFQKDVPDAFKNVSDIQLKEQFNTTNTAVVKALQSYQQWLQTSVLPHANGDYRLGAATFRKKLQYDEMVDTPLDKLLAINAENMKANQREFARIGKLVDPNKTPQQILAELGNNHPPENKLLATFTASFDDLIYFIKNKRIITIPSTVRPILEETPPFLRAITFASMDTPGPFEKHAKEAFFNVTIPKASWQKTRIAEFMSQFNFPVINNIAVHEAYPGHYVQFLWMHNLHDKVRQILGANSNTEGWAHYCEQMILDEGFGVGNRSPRDLNLLRLGQLQNALLRNARFAVGIMMHTGKMTFNQGVDFFVKEGYQTRTVGTVEAKRGATDPTYLYYTLGKLQILKLRHDVKEMEGGNFNLMQFHNDFMKQGFPPIKIVRRAMLHNDSATL